MSGYDHFYFLKKAWALYPGITRPVSATFLGPHYRARSATRGPLRAGMDALTGLLFHAWVPWRSASVQKKFGLDDAWRRRAIEIAHARFSDPNDIALYRIERSEQFDHYIRRFEDAAINKRINPLGWSRECVLADKERFAERCKSAGLPHPETHAVVHRAGIDIISDPAGRPLVAKPVHGEGGDGVMLLDGCADASELHLKLAGLPTASGRIWLVQSRVDVHPDLADIALNALPTVRIVTMFNENNRAEVVSATFRCASDPNARVDNMKAGGLIVPVDLDTGALGLACLGYGGDDHVVHPLTGGAIAGRRLPDWEKATALARRAHDSAFDGYTLIGWDVALTANEPLLIEGNCKPGVLMPQRAARRGLGEGRYGELLAHHLATKS